MKIVLLCVAVIILCVPAIGQVTNGDFSTGDFTGWTVFTTPQGTANNGAPPVVSSFDVILGIPSLAATFNVGQAGGGVTNEGGGIYQNITFAAGGSAFFSVDYAAMEAIDHNNSKAGLFEMLLDGSVLDFADRGDIFSGDVLRGTLTATQTVTAGTHELRLRITRPFPTSDSSPNQYLDNITVNGPGAGIVPEPSSALLFLGGAFPIAGLVFRRRKP